MKLVTTIYKKKVKKIILNTNSYDLVFSYLEARITDINENKILELETILKELVINYLGLDEGDLLIDQLIFPKIFFIICFENNKLIILIEINDFNLLSHLKYTGSTIEEFETLILNILDTDV